MAKQVVLVFAEENLLAYMCTGYCRYIYTSTANKAVTCHCS